MVPAKYGLAAIGSHLVSLFEVRRPLFVLGPFLPDAYLWWYRRKHEKKLEKLVEDLAREGETLDAYRPLSEVHEALGIGSEEAGTARDAESAAASRVRSR